MWKIIKKILRTICIWMIITLTIAIPVYAIDEPIETFPIPEYVTFRRYSDSQVRCSTGSNLPFLVAGWSADTTYNRIICKYVSALKKNTFYHMTYKIDLSRLPESYKQEYRDIGTGAITDQGGTVRTIMFPVNLVEGKITTGMNNELADIAWSSLESKAIESYVGAKAYYYFTIENDIITLDTIMYFNDEFWNYGWSFNASHARYMQCYLGIEVPLHGEVKLSDVSVYEVGDSDYNGKLDRIISLLQAQGGSLSKEDIQAATLAALEQHDAAEEQKGKNKIQQIKQQIESITKPYKENLTSLQDATRSITASLNYSGTTAVIMLPETRNPMTNNSLLWEEQEIDLGYYWEQLPQALRSAITIIFTFLILYKVIIEMVDEITWVIYMDKIVDKAERNAIGL